MRNNLEEIYQKVLSEGINQATPQLLEDLSSHSRRADNREAQTKIYRIVKKLDIDSHYKERYINRGVSEREAKVLGLLEALQGFPIRQISTEEFGWSNRGYFYSIDRTGSIIYLSINGYEGPVIWFFPEEICSLKELEILYFEGNKITQLPDCIKNLKMLKSLGLSYNNLTTLPIGLKTLPHLEYLNLQNNSNTFYLDNILDYIDMEEFEEEISMAKIEELMAEKLKALEEAKSKPWNLEISERVFPPKEVLKSKRINYIVLWMLSNNEVCGWRDFMNEPLDFLQSTFSNYIWELEFHQFIQKINMENGTEAFYRLTPFGVKKFKKMKNPRNK